MSDFDTIAEEQYYNSILGPPADDERINDLEIE